MRHSPNALLPFQDVDPVVRKAASTTVREIVKHSEGLSRLVVGCGGVPSLVD